MSRLRVVLVAVVCTTAIRVAVAAVVQADDPYARAVALVAQMTLDEKFSFVQQSAPKNKRNYTGELPGVPRLKIPPLRMNDGPQGFRGKAKTSTQWPSGLTVAHSFDPGLFLEWGEAMGAEFSAKGANCQFGPGLNVARISNGGRSFEYLSGNQAGAPRISTHHR